MAPGKKTLSKRHQTILLNAAKQVASETNTNLNEILEIAPNLATKSPVKVKSFVSRCLEMRAELQKRAARKHHPDAKYYQHMHDILFSKKEMTRATTIMDLSSRDVIDSLVGKTELGELKHSDSFLIADNIEATVCARALALTRIVDTRKTMSIMVKDGYKPLGMLAENLLDDVASKEKASMGHFALKAKTCMVYNPEKDRLLGIPNSKWLRNRNEYKEKGYVLIWNKGVLLCGKSE